MAIAKKELNVFLKLNKSDLGYNEETGEYLPIYTIASFDVSRPGKEDKTDEYWRETAIRGVIASKVVDSADCIEVISAEEYYGAVGDDEDDDDFDDDDFDDDDFDEDDDDFEDDEDGEIVDRPETMGVTG